MKTAWTNDELTSIGATEELQLASLSQDGTLRNRVTIWVVRAGDDLYVRSVNGAGAAWFRATQVRHEGCIGAGRVEKDVAFVDSAAAARAIQEQIDAVYRAKYGRYAGGIIRAITSPGARAATIKLTPR